MVILSGDFQRVTTASQSPVRSSPSFTVTECRIQLVCHNGTDFFFFFFGKGENAGIPHRAGRALGRQRWFGGGRTCPFLFCYFPPLAHKYLGEHGPRGLGRWLPLLLENVFLSFSGKSPSSDENKPGSHQRAQ